LVLMQDNCQYMFSRRRAGDGATGSIERRKLAMQWQTPKLVEIACGCEINAYFPADL
jgi:coenzyme PQQ precursor peptide PqqA